MHVCVCVCVCVRVCVACQKNASFSSSFWNIILLQLGIDPGKKPLLTCVSVDGRQPPFRVTTKSLADARHGRRKKIGRQADVRKADQDLAVAMITYPYSGDTWQMYIRTSGETWNARWTHASRRRIRKEKLRTYMRTERWFDRQVCFCCFVFCVPPLPAPAHTHTHTLCSTRSIPRAIIAIV